MESKLENNLLAFIENKDLATMDTPQLLEISQQISNSISLTKLRRSIDNAIKVLSGVGDPSFGADLEFIALDNQQRLNLIWMLLDRYNKIEANIKNFKKNKQNCKDNSDFLYKFIEETKEILETVTKYGQFRYKEKIEDQKYIETFNRKLLEGDANEN